MSDNCMSREVDRFRDGPGRGAAGLARPRSSRLRPGLLPGPPAAAFVRLYPVLAMLAGLACASDSDTRAGSTAALEDTLMQRIAAAYDFGGPDVVERMSALYPDTGRVISASGGYITTTAGALREGLSDFWANVGVNMTDPRWEWGDVHVDRLSADAAVLTASWSIPHIAPTGRPHTIRGAWTAVFRRIDGEWLIIQEHLSVPPEGQ